MTPVRAQTEKSKEDVFSILYYSPETFDEDLRVEVLAGKKMTHDSVCPTSDLRYSSFEILPDDFSGKGWFAICARDHNVFRYGEVSEAPFDILQRNARVEDLAGGNAKIESLEKIELSAKQLALFSDDHTTLYLAKFVFDSCLKTLLSPAPLKACHKTVEETIAHDAKTNLNYRIRHDTMARRLHWPKPVITAQENPILDVLISDLTERIERDRAQAALTNPQCYEGAKYGEFFSSNEMYAGSCANSLSRLTGQPYHAELCGDHWVLPDEYCVVPDESRELQSSL